MRIELEGDEALIARLLEMQGRARGLFKEALQDSVDHVANRAREGIANGPKTGRLYTQRVATSRSGGIFFYGSRPPHRASASDEYPAADTGNLMRSIWAEVDDTLAAMDAQPNFVQLRFDMSALDDAADELIGQMGADASYAIPLEYKPIQSGGRPFMRRALAESEDFVRQRFLQLRGRIVNG